MPWINRDLEIKRVIISRNPSVENWRRVIKNKLRAIAKIRKEWQERHRE
jgi:hypothetical protein